MVHESNNEGKFLRTLLLSDRQVSKLCEAFAGNSSANIKLAKSQLPKRVQSVRCLEKRFGQLLKSGLPLKENVLKPLARTVFISLGITATAAAAAED